MALIGEPLRFPGVLLNGGCPISEATAELNPEMEHWAAFRLKLVAV